MSKNEHGWNSEAYDAWRTAYPEEWDEPEEDPRPVMMGFMVCADVDGVDKTTFLMVSGEATSQEFYNGTRVYAMDEDGEIQYMILDPSAALWALIDKTLRTRTYDWLEDEYGNETDLTPPVLTNDDYDY